MTEDIDIELDYAYLTQKALRSVIQDVLQVTADLGDTPGEHHFYIEFMTNAPGVSITDSLKEAYPERMKIVLQHKFENLLVTDDDFTVTLHFNGIPETLVIPFDAITSFIDPSTEFALTFEMVEVANLEDEKLEEESVEEQVVTAEKETDGTADVVSLDSFRKK